MVPAAAVNLPRDPPWTAERRRALRWLLVICVLLVTHGSLFPWQFAAPASVAAAWHAMFEQDTWWTGRGDVAGNIVLFVPVGVLGLLAYDEPRAHWPRRVFAVALLAMAFAFALQVVQIWLPRRTPALSDVVWNALGLTLGLAIAGRVRPSAERLVSRRFGVHRISYVMAGVWLAIEWWPFMPSHSLGHIWYALNPLLRSPRWDLFACAEVALSLASVVHLARGMRRRTLFSFAVIAVAVLGKLLIGWQVITPSHAAGWLAGLLLGFGMWRLSDRRATALALVSALAWFTLDALRPFMLSPTPSGFQWVPLAASLQEQKIANTLALCWSLFWLGLVTLSAHTLGVGARRVAIALTAWALALEAAQTWLPGQLADITPALFPAVWWLLLRRLAPASLSYAARRTAAVAIRSM